MLLTLMGLALVSSPADAVTIDFDSLTPGQYTEAQFDAMFGATFDNTTDSVFNIDNVVNDPLYADFTRPNAVFNRNYGNPANSTRVTFATPATFVSVTMGDFDADRDDLHLRAYDASNNPLGSDFFANPASSYDGHTLSVAAAGIVSIEFWADGLNAANNVYWDNLTWDVPEPSTLILLGAGLVLCGARRRRADR